jgi:hypothetical protein
LSLQKKRHVFLVCLLKKIEKKTPIFVYISEKIFVLAFFIKKNWRKKKNLHVYLDLITSLLNLLRFDLNKLNHWAYIQKKQKYMFFFIKNDKNSQFTRFLKE